MCKFFLTLESVQNLDVQSGRLVGITQEPIYGQLAQAYELDLAQCFLWLDVVRIFNQVMDAYDYEDTKITHQEMGSVVKKILNGENGKFPFLKEFLIGNDLLEETGKLGMTIIEISEDISVIYQDIQQDLQKILSTQDEIDQIIDKKIQQMIEEQL